MGQGARQGGGVWGGGVRVVGVVGEVQGGGVLPRWEGWVRVAGLGRAGVLWGSRLGGGRGPEGGVGGVAGGGGGGGGRGSVAWWVHGRSEMPQGGGGGAGEAPCEVLVGGRWSSPGMRELFAAVASRVWLVVRWSREVLWVCCGGG